MMLVGNYRRLVSDAFILIRLILLGQCDVVRTYRGGVAEVPKGRFVRGRIDREGRRGFAGVAIETGVPVIPVASIGVNGGRVLLSSGRCSAGSCTGKCRDPDARGVGGGKGGLHGGSAARCGRPSSGTEGLADQTSTPPTDR